MAYDDKDKDSASGDAGASNVAAQQSSANADRRRDSQSDRSKGSEDKGAAKGETGADPLANKDPVVAAAIAANGLSAVEQLQSQQYTQVSGSADPTTCTADNPSGAPAQRGPQLVPWDGIDRKGTSLTPDQYMEIIAAAPIAVTLIFVAKEALGPAYVGYEILSKTYEYIEYMRDATDGKDRQSPRK